MRRLLAYLAAFLAATTAHALPLPPFLAGQQTAPGYYLAASGGVDGACTRSVPCATPAYVQAKMRAGAVKTAYLLPGTYPFSSAFQLAVADDGQHWRGAPGQRWDAAVIEGAGLIESAFCIRGGSSITISRLKIVNVRYAGVIFHGGAAFGPNDCTKGATVGEARGNKAFAIEVDGVTVPDASRYADTGGVLAQGRVPGTVIANIVVADSNGMCVRASADGGTDDISGLRIVNSVFRRCMKRNGDGGSIYTQDYLATSTDILIDNNYVIDYGNGEKNNVRCFYADAASAQITFTRNICGAPGSQVVDGNASVIYLCGKNNVVGQNIFDLGSTGRQILYQYGGCGAPAVTSAMTGNTFFGNVVVGHWTGAQQTSWVGWTGTESFYSGGTQPAYPAIGPNLYWNYAGGAISTAGVVMSGDASPVRADPQCSGGALYQIAAGSPAYAAGYADPPRNWGPPGYAPPTAGAASSSCPPATASACAPSSTFSAANPGAAGYALAFDETFASLATIDLTNSKAPGFNWYTGTFFGSTATASTAFSLAGGGGVTISPAASAGNYNLASAMLTADGAGYVGRAFGGGAYFEAKVKFNPSSVNTADGWPSFWAIPIEHGLHNVINADRWPGQSSVISRYIETDFFEADITWAMGSAYGWTMHDWYGDPAGTCGYGYRNGQGGFCDVLNGGSGAGSSYSNNVVGIAGGGSIDWTVWHTVGMLWVPATANGGTGYAQAYLDGQPAGAGSGNASPARITWSASAGETPSTLQGSTGAWSRLDAQHLVLILGTGPSSPLTVGAVRVWQIPGCAR